MRVRDVLNEKYAELCKQLGDLEVQKSLIEKRTRELTEEIRSLDKVVPLVGDLEVKEEETAPDDSESPLKVPSDE